MVSMATSVTGAPSEVGGCECGNGALVTYLYYYSSMCSCKINLSTDINRGCSVVCIQRVKNNENCNTKQTIKTKIPKVLSLCRMYIRKKYIFNKE